MSFTTGDGVPEALEGLWQSNTVPVPLAQVVEAVVSWERDAGS